jgi:hypothetical protein
MKRFLLFLSFFIYSVTSLCQQVPNGGLELWDTVATPFLIDWLYNGSYASLPCAPFPVSVERTNDANSGNWAARMEAKFCMDDLGVPKVYIGFITVGNHILYPELGYGIYYSGKPDYLNFYYKFNRVGSDTGFARIILREYDGTGYGPIIGEGKALIINDTNNYTYISVPIDYYSMDTPGVLQIIFATSKTMADQQFIQFVTNPGIGAEIGTVIWVDDISISGGTLDTPQFIDLNDFQIYPNPTNDNSIIKFNNLDKGDYSLQLYNAQGKSVKYLNNISSQEIILKKENLNSGMYFFQIKSNNEIIHTGKWVIN